MSAATPSGMLRFTAWYMGLRSPAVSATMPGMIQSSTVMANAAAVDFCAVVQPPRAARERWMSSRLPSISFTPAGERKLRYAKRMKNSTTTTGAPIIIQRKNEISMFTISRMNPRPMMFGGVPIGVSSPPIEAAKAVINISPVA
jgi:hypothetical protein